MQREKVSVKSKGKFDVEKIRDFTYKIEEYERQKKEVLSVYEEAKKQENHKTSLFIYGGGSGDLTVTLSESGAEHIIDSLCKWYDKKISECKDGIRTYL